MKACPSCGASVNDGVIFCPSCGHEFTTAPEQSEAPQSFASIGYSPLTPIFGGSLFLTICILSSVYTLFSFGILQILFTIFNWLLYADARNQRLKIDNMRTISGVVYASKIVLRVAGIIVVVCGVLMLAFGNAIPQDAVAEAEAITDEIIAALKTEGIPEEAIDIVKQILDGGIRQLFVYLAAFMIGAGAYLIICSVLWSFIHKYTKNLYTEAAIGNITNAHAKAAKGCMIAFAVINLLSLVFTFNPLFGFYTASVQTLLMTLCYSAIYVIAAKLIDSVPVDTPKEAQEAFI